MTRARQTRVVVISESVVRRANLVRILEVDGDIRALASAGNAADAVPLLARHSPHVVTIDLAAATPPRALVETLASAGDAPILALATTADGATAVEVLAAGAADVLPFPARGNSAGEALLRARVRSLRNLAPRAARERLSLPPTTVPQPGVGVPVVAIGASTGGPAALGAVLGALEGLRAAVLVVQHLHADFVSGLVRWLGERGALGVACARAGERLRPGVVHVAPGEVHLRLGPGGQLRLDPHPHALHRPSVDELFTSVAEHARHRGVGVLLTGMGNDGAQGLLAIRNAGGVTIAQDEATSAVFGMPRAAVELGAAQQVLPLAAIPAAVRAAVERVRQ